MLATVRLDSDRASRRKVRRAEEERSVDGRPIILGLISARSGAQALPLEEVALDAQLCGSIPTTVAHTTERSTVMQSESKRLRIW